MAHASATVRLAAIEQVDEVITGPQALTVYAFAPAPFREIAAVAYDLPVVQVVEFTQLSAGASERWRATNVRAFADRNGVLMRPDQAWSYANHIGVIDAPTLNVRKGRVMGMVFQTLDDAERYDAIASGLLRAVSTGDFSL